MSTWALLVQVEESCQGMNCTLKFAGVKWRILISGDFGKQGDVGGLVRRTHLRYSCMGHGDVNSDGNSRCRTRH